MRGAKIRRCAGSETRNAPALGAGLRALSKLEERRSSLASRFAEKDKERSRWLHLYAQGHISSDELEIHLAETAGAWLAALRERTAEVEADTEEAYATRKELVRLLVEAVVVDRNEDGRTRVRITYRFGPPEPLRNEEAEEDRFVHGIQNSVIQCGADNPYGHPKPEVLDRLHRTGARVFRNDEHGDVIVTIKEGRVEVAVTKPGAAS